MMDSYSWPDTPFDKSMIGQNVIVRCPEENLAKELIELFRDNGIKLYGTISPTRTRWEEYGAETCYRICSDYSMNFGTCDTYLGGPLMFRRYIKCTFYGTNTPEEDFDINEEEFLALLKVGGK